MRRSQKRQAAAMIEQGGPFFVAKKKEITQKRPVEPPLEPTLQPITETLRTNYMPYAMSVIVSRAIPEIDGFKPSHRKLLYTMYKICLLYTSRCV